MRVVRITSEIELQRLRPAWNHLAQDVPFRMWEWLHPWWRHYGRGRELYVLAVYDDRNELRGLAPWMLESSAREGRCLRFLGSGEVCSDYQSVLATAEFADRVAAALAEWLTRNACGRRKADPDHRWDLLELSGVDAQDHAIEQLVADLRCRGNAVYCRPGLNCWRIELPARWEDWLATLSKSHRKKLNRLARNALSSERARIRWAREPHETETGMKILVDLHQRRRQALGEPGCFSSEPFCRFLHEAAAALAADRRLGLFWIEWDGRPITAEFQLIAKNTVYAYQAGMDPDCLDLQPGRLSCIAGVRQAIADGRTAFDFLRGDEPYKAQWRATARRSLLVRVAPRKPLALVRHATWVAGRRAKDMIKSGLEAVGARRLPESERRRKGLPTSTKDGRGDHRSPSLSAAAGGHRESPREP